MSRRRTEINDLAAICLAASLVFASFAARGGAREDRIAFTLSGAVDTIEDGDTLTLRSRGGVRFTIRLSDIDAPEIAHPATRGRRACACTARAARPGQRGGQAARAALERSAPPGTALRAECYEVDRYGRTVCHLFAGSVNINRAMLADGYAEVIDRPQWVRDPDSYATEAQARAARRGLWSDRARVSPGTFRRRCWNDGACTGADSD